MSDPYLSFKPQKVHSSCSIKSLIKEMLPGIQAMGQPVPDCISGRGIKSRDGGGPGHLTSSPRRLEVQPNPSDLEKSHREAGTPQYFHPTTACSPPPLPASSLAPLCTTHPAQGHQHPFSLAQSPHLPTLALCLYSSLTLKCSP